MLYNYENTLILTLPLKKNGTYKTEIKMYYYLKNNKGYVCNKLFFFLPVQKFQELTRKKLVIT